MNTHADKSQEIKSQAVAHRVPKLQGHGELTFQFVDNRPEAIAQRKLQEMANNSPQVKRAPQLQTMANNYFAQQQNPIQKKENNTGLPDNLKTGMENLSGMSLDDVKVHYNSDKPAQLQAHAYAQGTDIHLGPGQERHLPHETWHVVQQKQGRVRPTMQMKAKANVNDDAELEKEADVMGAKAHSVSSLQTKNNVVNISTISNEVVQRAVPSPGHTYPKPIPTTGSYRARGGEDLIFSMARFPREVFRFGNNTRQEVLSRPEFHPQPPHGRVATITDLSTHQRVNVEGAQLDHRLSWFDIASAMENHNRALLAQNVQDMGEYYTFFDAKMYYNDLENLFPVLGAMNAAAGAAGVAAAAPIPEVLRGVLDVLSDSTNHLRATLVARFSNAESPPPTEELCRAIFEIADHSSSLAAGIFVSAQ